jgi:ABC-2 type transport system ATP-binding protein
VPQGPGFYEEVTAGEYLELARRVYERGDIASTAALFDLGPHLSKPMAALSAGFQRRLLLAAALLSEPEVLLLDEPTVGLDPMAAREVREHLRNAMAKRTVLFSTHNLAEAEALCDSVIVLRAGRVLLHEPIAAVRQRFPRHALLAAHQGPAALLTALYKDGLEARAVDSHVEVNLAQPQVALPDLLRRLLAEGLDIYEARTIEPSLEDIFVTIVQNGGPAEEAQ